MILKKPLTWIASGSEWFETNTGLKPCTVVVLYDNNLKCASGTFTNVVWTNFATRSSLALICYSIL